MKCKLFSALASLSLASVAIGQAPSGEELERREMERRAVEAVIWGMPIVNYDLMLQEMITEAKGRPNQIVYWSRLSDWKNQTLTPNPDSIYLMPFFNTKDVGPIVIEIPRADTGSINGTIMDVWQSPLDDVGPAGADKGKGGKYLVLPPGYNDTVPAGYIALPSSTNQGYALLRSILKSGSAKDTAAAVAYGRRIKLYPLSQAADPPATTFVDASGLLYDASIPYDHRFFQSLNRIVQQEPWLTRDKLMIDQLRSIGIQRGKPFEVDPGKQAVLNSAAAEAHARLEARYLAGFNNPALQYFDTSRWGLPNDSRYVDSASKGFTDEGDYPTDDRGMFFSFAFFTPKHLGQGQFYLMTVKDKDGQLLHGMNNYRLNVPANAPVSLYWSATAYNRATHTLIRNAKWPGRSSQTPGLKKESDGSVNLHFGPQAPSGQETNWVPVDPNGEFEVLFRFYGPQKPLFEKSWKLPDIEKVGP